MAKQNDIPVHKVHIKHPQTDEMGWTFRVATFGTFDIEHIAENIGRRLLVDPSVAATIFNQIGRAIIDRVQMGYSVDMGVLGYLQPKIKNAGWAEREEDMTLHGTSGFVHWTPSKLTKNAFYGVGCTLDWQQRERNRQRGIKDDDFDDDRYPLEVEN